MTTILYNKSERGVCEICQKEKELYCMKSDVNYMMFARAFRFYCKECVILEAI